jgi:hypothetical protein
MTITTDNWSIPPVNTELSASNLCPAVEEFIDLISSERELSSLFTAAIAQQEIGPKRFANKLCRLLELYRRDLLKEARKPEQRLAAKFIQSKARLISSSIGRQHDPEYQKAKKIIGQPELDIFVQKRHEEVERYLQKSSGNDISDPQGEAQDKRVISDSEDSNVQERLHTLKNVQDFMLSCKAFQALQENLHRFVETPHGNQDKCRAIDEIAEAITDAIRKDGIQRIVFVMYWELIKFVRSELDGCWDIGTALTLSGIIQKAYATSCREYIERFWPDIGVLALEAITSALARGEGDCKSPSPTNHPRSFY